MRPISDWVTSRSLKPEDARTKFLVLAIPVFISRLPLRRVYLCALRSTSNGMRLTSHTTRNRSTVHVQSGMPRNKFAALNALSSQITMAARRRIATVLARALGRIQGLPVQSAEPDVSFWVVDIEKTC